MRMKARTEVVAPARALSWSELHVISPGSKRQTPARPPGSGQRVQGQSLIPVSYDDSGQIIDAGEFDSSAEGGWRCAGIDEGSLRLAGALPSQRISARSPLLGRVLPVDTN